ncbi:MAG: hypothetical protein L7F77_05045 [Candidatus Magnetominusculus sp. LBB02]|nr:hypothetical protein [Candidatus Magnetominusculus sp. LBB02]
MLKIKFTEDENDLLRETFNLALGQAGDKLARLLKSFVDLSVPQINILEVNIIEAEKVASKVLDGSIFTTTDSITALSQSFSLEPHLDGEGIVIFNDRTIQTVAEIFGIDKITDRSEEIDIMYELTNLIAGACLNGISNRLFNKEMSFKSPVILVEKTDLLKFVYGVFQRSQLKWDHTLMVRITFALKQKDFKSELLVFMSERSIEAVQGALQRMLAEMFQ